MVVIMDSFTFYFSCASVTMANFAMSSYNVLKSSSPVIFSLWWNKRKKKKIVPHFSFFFIIKIENCTILVLPHAIYILLSYTSFIPPSLDVCSFADISYIISTFSYLPALFIQLFISWCHWSNFISHICLVSFLVSFLRIKALSLRF